MIQAIDDMTSQKKNPPAIPFDAALKRVWNAAPKPNPANKAALKKTKAGKLRSAQR
jgi:hypothetical protein